MSKDINKEAELDSLRDELIKCYKKHGKSYNSIGFVIVADHEDEAYAGSYISDERSPMLFRAIEESVLAYKLSYVKSCFPEHDGPGDGLELFSIAHDTENKGEKATAADLIECDLSDLVDSLAKKKVNDLVNKADLEKIFTGEDE